MPRISSKEFRQLSDYIHEQYGIYLKDEKRSLLEGRLQHVLEQKGFDTFGDYFGYLIGDRTGEAVTELVNRVTTNHTFFMREPEHFRYFREKALPYAIQKSKDRDLRIWSAGCSSGEEPYTLAMLVDEALGKDKAAWDAKILATDISNKVLDTAKAGVYANERIAALPTSWKLNYFKQADREFMAIHEKIQSQVIFRRFNLMEPVFPFKRKFHIIFCRNVMIYFDAPTKAALIRKFYDWLEDGGYLFIGQSEALPREETPFRYVLPAVYRKV